MKEMNEETPEALKRNHFALWEKGERKSNKAMASSCKEAPKKRDFFDAFALVTRKQKYILCTYVLSYQVTTHNALC